MQAGGWVPICKSLAKYLPRDRPYTELEAAFSLQIDYDQGNSVTIAGYSDLWRWSKGKVLRFLDKLGIRIEYPESTERKQNQRGLIMILITDRYRADNGQIRLIDSRWLADHSGRNRTDNGLKADRSRVATRDPRSLDPRSKIGVSIETPMPESEKFKPSPCPHRKIIDLYHSECPELPQVRVWNESSKRDLKIRWREDPDRQDLGWWRVFFRDKVAASDFLAGKVNDFQANLGWIVKSANFAKILNGQYQNRGPRTGSRQGDANMRAGLNWLEKDNGK